MPLLETLFSAPQTIGARRTRSPATAGTRDELLRQTTPNTKGRQLFTCSLLHFLGEIKQEIPLPTEAATPAYASAKRSKPGVGRKSEVVCEST